METVQKNDNIKTTKSFSIYSKSRFVVTPAAIVTKETGRPRNLGSIDDTGKTIFSSPHQPCRLWAPPTLLRRRTFPRRQCSRGVQPIFTHLTPSEVYVRLYLHSRYISTKCFSSNNTDNSTLASTPERHRL